MIEFVLWLVICFISTFSFVYLFYRLNDMSDKITILKVFVFLIGVIIQTFICFYEITFLNMITYFIFFSIMFYIIKPMKIKDIFFYLLIIWIYALCVDLGIMLLVMFVNIFIKFNMISVKVETITTSLFVLIFVALANSKKIKNFTNKLHIRFNELKYLDTFIIIFLGFASLVCLVIFLNLHHLDTNLLLYLVLFLLVLVFIILVKYKINTDETEKYLETLRENNDFYIKIDAENRIFKHNLMAKLTSIKSVSNKKAIALIDDFVIKTNKNIKYSKGIKEIPYGLNGIIYQKTYPYLEDINFKVINKIDFDIFKVLKPRRYNVLVEKMVLSLDNAIEASLNSKNKVVVINLYDDEENIYIEIKNSFSHNIDIDSLGGLNYSTKSKKRGFGLFSALRDSEASLNVKIVNNYFISVISARKQK